MTFPSLTNHLLLVRHVYQSIVHFVIWQTFTRGIKMNWLQLIIWVRVCRDGTLQNKLVMFGFHVKTSGFPAAYYWRNTTIPDIKTTPANIRRHNYIFMKYNINFEENRNLSHIKGHMFNDWGYRPSSTDYIKDWPVGIWVSAPPVTGGWWWSRPGWRRGPWKWKGAAWQETGDFLLCLWSAGCRRSYHSWSPAETPQRGQVTITDSTCRLSAVQEF